MSQGSSRPPLLPPIPFRIYLPPRKTKFQALRSTLHPALWFSADFFLFLFSDAARSSTVIFETSDSYPFMTINLTAHLLTPAHSRASAPPTARVCGVRGNPLFLEPRNPPNLTVTSIFSRHAGVGPAASPACSAFSRTLVRRDDRERTRRARARATSVRFRGSTKGKSEGACRPLL